MSWHSTPFFFYWLLVGFYITSGELTKPIITAIPSRVINRGDNVTIRCEGTSYKVQFCLLKGYNKQCLEAKEYTADFPIMNANEDSGVYYCLYYDSRHNPNPWSPYSDPLSIQVIDLRKPEISWDIDVEDKSKARVKCTAHKPPKEYQLLRCFLYKNRTPLTDKNFIENSLSCTFSVLVLEISELRCLYVVQVLDSTHQIRSPLSDSVEPANDWLLAGFYITSGEPPMPTITAIPSRVIYRGDNVTIRCEGASYKARLCLQKGYNKQCLEAKEYTADFPIMNANEKDSGDYYCHYYDSRHNPNLWSPYSDPLSIQVIDLRKPEISWDIDPEDRSKARVKCIAPEPSEEYQLLQCLLYKNRTHLTDKNFIANSLSCTFSVLVLDISELRCLYVVQVLDSTHQILSPLSDSAEPANGQDYTTVNIIRLLLSGIILFTLGIIVQYHTRTNQPF